MYLVDTAGSVSRESEPHLGYEGIFMVSHKRWDFYAGFYNPLLRLVAAQRRQVFTHLALTEPQQIYLPGCGSGLDLGYMPIGSQVHAMDFSETMLAKCDQQVQQLARQGHSLEVALRQRVAESSGLPDQSVDLVILHLILAVMDNPESLLEETFRVLKWGGRISIWDKFLPAQQSAGALRRIADFFSRKLGTTLLLDIDGLLERHSLVIIKRYSMLHGQMQHLILEKR